MDVNEVKVKVTAETAEAEAQLAALEQRARAVVGALASRHTLAIACAALLAVLIVVGISLGVLSKHQSEALAAAQNSSDRTAQLMRDTQESMDKRETAWLARQTQWEAERAAIKTAPQAVKVIEKYIPTTTGQSVADVKAAQIAPEIRQQLPDSPSYVVKTQQAEVETAKAVQAGEQCKDNLAKCQGDVIDLRAQVQAITGDRDNWRDTANGGSKSKRLVRGGLIGACGAAGAMAGAQSSNRTTGAAIGSLTGAVLCAIFTK